MINLNKNLDEKTMNNIKNSINNGNIDEAISQISPEMLENFSKMLSNNKENNNNIDPNNIDINNIMKLASSININNKDDPRKNLLNALKPYMRDSKKDKMDNYLNMLDMAKIADLLNKNQKGNHK